MLMRTMEGRRRLLFLAVTGPLLATLAADGHAGEPKTADAEATAQLARLVAERIQAAIPRQYDKKVDWGTTTSVTSGLRTHRDGLRVKIRRRKKQVDHGVWKHYRLRVVDPEQDLNVRVMQLRPLKDNRAGLTLVVDARLAAWGRAKAYQYGIHLIALEIVGQAQVRMRVDCEVGLLVDQKGDRPAVALDLHVAAANVDVVDLKLDRISNARGPIVRELGDGLHRVVRSQLASEELTPKLNHAIEKRKSRLRIETPELFGTTSVVLDDRPSPAD